MILFDSNVFIEAMNPGAEALLTATTEIFPTVAIINRAVSLRQQRKMSLGDALIAATAMVEGLPLATRNIKDFRWIDGLTLVEPPAYESGLAMGSEGDSGPS